MTNSCTRAWFWLHCTLGNVSPANIYTRPIFNDPVVVMVGEEGEDKYGQYHGNK